jgi:hypothetical protein
MDPVIDTLEASAQLGYPARQRRSRLRVAAYIGEVHWNRRGSVRTAVNDLFRMLQPRPSGRRKGVARIECLFRLCSVKAGKMTEGDHRRSSASRQARERPAGCGRP